MTRYNARFYTNKGAEILNTKIECTPENIPDMLASIVMDYLKSTPYPGIIKAGVTDNRHHMEYTLLIENNKLHVYLHVEKATRDGSAVTVPAPSLLQGSFGQGTDGPMTRYIVRLYSDNDVQIYGERIECNVRDVPGRLICIMRDYLKGVPYPGVIKAHVIDGRKYTEYILLLKNDILDVCLHVLEADRVEVQEPPDMEESAR